MMTSIKAKITEKMIEFYLERPAKYSASFNSTKCKKGYYKPLSPKNTNNHSFVCDKCGDTVHYEAQVVVE